MAVYHNPDDRAPCGYYRLEVWEKSDTPETPRNAPLVSVGSRWFRLRSHLLHAATEERQSGRYVEAYYVLDDDRTEDVRI